MVVVRIKENSKQAKAVIAMLKTFPFVEVDEEPNRYNDETEKAIRDARAGKNMIRAKNAEELLKKLKI
jgi:hypothetical protein